MPKKAANPFPGNYEPELDTTPTLNPELSSWYASLIGMLRWMVEIGQVDIITEVSKMASHQMASPREGHLDALMHIFGFLQINHNSRMAYNPSYPTIDMNVFKPNDWKSFYGNVEGLSPASRRNRVERMSIYDCMSTATMLGRSARAIRARAS